MRRLLHCVAVAFLFSGCGGCGGETGDSVVLRWRGDADLDMEIWDSSGSHYLRDVAGDSAVLDAAGGSWRNNEIWNQTLLPGETSVVLAVGCWDFRGEEEVPAEIEVLRGADHRTYRAILTPQQNLWKVVRWEPDRNEEIPIEILESRRFETSDSAPPFPWGR